MNELIELKRKLLAELNNFIVKDTFTKGKNTGLRKAIILIDDMVAELIKEKL